MAPSRKFALASVATLLAFSALSQAAVIGEACTETFDCDLGMACVSDKCVCDQSRGYALADDNTCKVFCPTSASGVTRCEDGEILECNKDGTFKCGKCDGSQFTLNDTTKHCELACDVPHCKPENVDCNSIFSGGKPSCSMDGCEDGYKQDMMTFQCVKLSSDACDASDPCSEYGEKCDTTTNTCKCDGSRGFKGEHGSCYSVCAQISLECQECNVDDLSKCTKCEDGFYGPKCESKCPKDPEETCSKITCTDSSKITCLDCINTGYIVNATTGLCEPSESCIVAMHGCDPKKSMCTGDGDAWCTACLPGYKQSGLGCIANTTESTNVKESTTTTTAATEPIATTTAATEPIITTTAATEPIATTTAATEPIATTVTTAATEPIATTTAATEPIATTTAATEPIITTKTSTTTTTTTTQGSTPKPSTITTTTTTQGTKTTKSDDIATTPVERDSGATNQSPACAVAMFGSVAAFVLSHFL